MARAAWLVLAGFGCDRVVGVEQVGDQYFVHGTISSFHVHNDSSFAPVVDDSMLPSSLVSLQAVLEDGTRQPVEYHDDGTFMFELGKRGERYRLQMMLDGNRYETAHDAADLHNGLYVAGRVDRRQVTATRLQFPYPVAGTAQWPALVASTGIYTLTYTALYGPTVTFDWRLATPAGGSVPAMLDAASYDRAYAIELENVSSPPMPTYMRIRAVSSDSITQVTNGIATLPQPAPVAPNQCFRVVAPVSQFHQKLVAAAPREYAASASEWFAFAAPAADIMWTVGALWVAASSFPATDDLDATPEVHVPYPGMTLVAEAGAVERLQVQLPGTTPAVLENSIRIYDKAIVGAPGACAVPPTTLAATIGVVGDVTLAGTLLDTDGQVVSVDLTKQLDVTWSMSDDGPVNIYGVQLYELVAADGATSTVLVHAASAVKNRWTAIDPGVLAAGHKYIFLVVSTLSRPDADRGDLLTLAWPIETSSNWSHWFEVQAP